MGIQFFSLNTILAIEARKAGGDSWRHVFLASLIDALSTEEL